MHAATWGCGGSNMICGRLTGIEIPQSPRYTPGDCGAADGNCGIKSFSSYDFVNWTLLDFYQPPSSVANITKPVVRYSNATAQYVMVMGGNVIEGNFFYTASRSPSGPWGMSPKTMHGEDISHDFDIAVGPDGTHYMVTDVWTHKFTSDAVPMWDLWVHQLAPNLTSTMDNASSVLFRRGEDLWKGQGLTLEAVGFFLPRRLLVHHLGRDCSKRRRLPGYVYYHYAQNPLGPWKDGGIVSMDGCGAQIKGINVLPSDQGPVILAGMLGYRTGPSNYITQGNIHNFGAHVWHADNQQAAASSYLFPIEFNVDHTNKNWTCPTSVKIPLANSVNNQPEEPTAYQLDCRVRIWQDVIATFDPPIKSTRLQFPVWQRTDNLAPTINAGPVLNGRLNVIVELTNS